MKMYCIGQVSQCHVTQTRQSLTGGSICQLSN